MYGASTSGDDSENSPCPSSARRIAWIDRRPVRRRPHDRRQGDVPERKAGAGIERLVNLGRNATVVIFGHEGTLARPRGGRLLHVPGPQSVENDRCKVPVALHRSAPARVYRAKATTTVADHAPGFRGSTGAGSGGGVTCEGGKSSEVGDGAGCVADGG